MEILVKIGKNGQTFIFLFKKLQPLQRPRIVSDKQNFQNIEFLINNKPLINLTPQQFSVIIELMNEIEGAKETAGELPKDASKELPKETLKEPKFQKAYRVFSLIQNIFLGTLPVLGLILGILQTRYNPTTACCQGRSIEEISKIQNSGRFFGNTFTALFLFGFLMNILFIIIGIVFYFNRTDKNKKTVGKNFILRGIFGLMIVFMTWFVITIVSGLFGIDISCLCLPNLL